MNNQHIVLIGGGHAQVAVLADWIKHGRPAPATLITPNPELRYSGMVPGWIAGEHSREAGLVDLAGLARNAGVELVLDRCVHLDPENCLIETEGGAKIPFDIASIDTGGVGRAAWILGDDPRILDVRPIDQFVEALAANERAHDIAVVGGGAGGVELAFALRNRGDGGQVSIATGVAGLLPGFSRSVVKRVEAEMKRQGLQVIAADAVIDKGCLRAGQTSLDPDLIVAALGSAAPHWPRESGLAVDDAGFIAVDRFQRSTSHPHIFATGDVAARTDRDVPHSGVHAVHAGPVLAANLRSILRGEPVAQSYTPRPASLYLVSTGDGGAILSYGGLSLQGKWAGRLKRWIDKRWITKYARLAGQA